MVTKKKRGTPGDRPTWPWGEGSDVGHRTEAEAHYEAEKLGLKCVVAEGNEILVDIDKPNAQANMLYDMGCHVSIEKVWEDGGVVETPNHLRTVSKSGNTHIYFLLNYHLPPSERIAIQLSLGSDPVKEMLSLGRVIEQSEAPICLFETDAEYQRVMDWRKGRA